MPKKTFLLVDAHAVIYRAFYGFPIQLTDATGQPMNAVYGFSRILLTALRHFDPEYIAVTFDHPKPTFRHQQFADYKAQRAEMPDQLQPQIPLVKQVVEALNIPQYEIAGFEADDLIGTISDKVEKIGGLLTVVVSGDQDLFQLVDHNTHVWLPGRGKLGQDKEYDALAVEQKLGIKPKQVIDYKAIVGDSSDNIPGVRGVGPKTAVELLKKYQNLENIYLALEQGSSKPEGEQAKAKPKPKNSPNSLFKPAVESKLLASKEIAFMSKQLATIERVVDLDFSLENCRLSTYDKTKVVKLFTQFDFKSLISLLPEDQFEKQIQESLF